eukprot:m.171155 g.171155  ORF g.171155 m.171155 type:complete len:108 (+) comp18279_c0_seq1:1664-1987(+)
MPVMPRAFCPNGRCPDVTGTVVQPATTTRCTAAWEVVFYAAAATYAFGGLQFLIFGGMDPVYNTQRQDRRRSRRKSRAPHGHHGATGPPMTPGSIDASEQRPLLPPL